MKQVKTKKSIWKLYNLNVNSIGNIFEPKTFHNCDETKADSESKGCQKCKHSHLMILQVLVQLCCVTFGKRGFSTSKCKMKKNAVKRCDLIMDQIHWKKIDISACSLQVKRFHTLLYTLYTFTVGVPQFRGKFNLNVRGNCEQSLVIIQLSV